MTPSALLSGASLPAAVFALCLAAPAGAQITLDGSLGTAGALGGPNFSIGANLGQQLGGNLFHSFSQFNVLTGQSATFSGPASVSNIISRVTGGSASTIDGLLRSTISGANLFLVNPNGVMFGPNASLNVSGSFHVSTANYLLLGSTGRFDATNPGASVLSLAPPSAFGFLGPIPAALSVNGASLAVPAGKTLALVAGDISISNSALLSAPSGQLALASLRSGGEVTLGPAGIATQSVGAFGDISLSHSTGQTDSAFGLPSGSITIRGGNLVMTGARLSANNASLFSGGDVRIVLSADLAMSDGFVRANTSGFGAGGDIEVQARSVNLANGAQIDATTFGFGAGGTLSVTASDSIAISGRNAANLRSGLFANAQGASFGDAGAVVVSTPVLGMSDGAILQTATSSLGNGGALEVNAGSVTLAGGATLDASSYGLGNSGAVVVNASGSVMLTGRGTDNLRSGLYAGSFAPASGNAGSVAVAAAALTVDGGAVIRTASTGSGNAGPITASVGALTVADGANLDSSAYGAGNAGAISVHASGAVSVTGASPDNQVSGLFATAAGPGNAGAITVSAASVAMDRGTIESSSDGAGNGGRIELNVGRLTLTNGGYLFANTRSSGDGGTLAVNASESVAITGIGPDRAPSGLFSNATEAATGSAGPIIVNTPLLTMDGGQIQSATNVAGNAGSIELHVGRMTLTNGAQISASSNGAGNSGTLTVVATESVSLSERGTNTLLSGLFSEANGGGNAGAVSVSAPELNLSEAQIRSTTSAGGSAGGVSVNVARLNLTNGGQISTSTFGSGSGGVLTVNATESILISGLSSEGPSSGLFSSSNAGGNARSMTVTAPAITVADNGIISSSANGTGNAGSISINAARINLMTGGQITASTVGPGKGGVLSVTATESMTVTGASAQGTSSGVLAFAQGAGDAGAITIAAPVLDIENAYIQSLTESGGNAGNISLQVGRLSLANGAQINASSFGAGRAGLLNVSASESIRINGTAGSGFGTGLFSEAHGAGDAGRIAVSTPLLTMDGGFIQSVSIGSGSAGGVTLTAGELLLANGAQINASTAGLGSGGTLNVAASGSIAISGVAGDGSASGLFSGTDGAQAGGSITVTARNVSIGDGGGISTQSLGTGNAGGISIAVAESLRLQNGAGISTESASGDGGDIHITARDLLYLRDSQITTSVGTGQGNGGNIFIDPVFVVLDNGQIIANAFGGNGGNINIVSEFFLASPDSLVQASSALGVQGTVTVTAPNVNLGAGLVALPGSFFDAASQIRASCSARAARGSNSFTGAARGGLPAGPEHFGFGAYTDSAAGALAAVGGESMAATAVQLACLQ